jgi:Flp pilus assembly protein TadG
MTIELVLLTPFVVILFLVIVGLGRIALGALHVEQAAAAAARAASLASSPVQAGSQARQAATDTLHGAGMTCRSFRTEVGTGSFRPGGVVTAEVTCTADLAGLAMAGLPGAVTIRADSRSPLERHRDYGP